MIVLNAKLREERKKKNKKLREKGRIPGVVYGHKVKNVLIDVDAKEFMKVFKEVGESSLFNLQIEGEKEQRPVLMHEVQRNPLTDEVIHIDLFQISLKEEVEVEVPLVFEGVAPAVKELGGTLVKNIDAIKIKALPQNLPHEIKVSVEGLKTFEDHILVKDIVLPQGVKILEKEDEIVASVVPPTNVEEELAKEITEQVEEVEKVEREKKEEEVIQEPERKEEKDKS